MKFVGSLVGAALCVCEKQREDEFASWENVLQHRRRAYAAQSKFGLKLTIS